MGPSFCCDIHGLLKDNEIRIVTIKGIEYKRCRECQRIKDRKYSKTYRNKNKEYYAIKKKEHYESKPEMQVARNRKWRLKKKLPL